MEQLRQRIAQLEQENEELRERVAYLEGLPQAGRRKHDEKWLASYHEFEVAYETGMGMVEIVKTCNFSRRTAYRYLEYYKELHQMVSK